ncbi:MAG: CoA-binding protein [Actinophytocola sp.]|nr:CoA-binding protein [Actinophytocola sp.]
MSRILHPRSVALVGVSGRAESLNARPLRYLLDRGYEGAIYPINPNYDELEGLRCYENLADVPEPVDLVLVLVAASQSAAIVRQAGTVGATAAVIFASGFAETGAAGAELQEELRGAGRKAGVRVLGPNCQGVIYAPTGMAATFTAAADRPLGGQSGVAYVGQSGAVGGSVLDLAAEMGLGLTAWVSTGNQADLDLVEVAAALVEDDAVQVVMLYAEVISDGAAYTHLAQQVRVAGKHLVVLVSGRSDAGRRAAASHTGSMLGDDVAFVLTSKRYGVTLVDDVDELLAVAATVGSVRDMQGRRVGVITTSGGAGSLAADHCASHDLELPELGPDAQDRLAPLVPDFGALANPVDVTAQLFNRDGSARALGEVCTIVAEDPEVDLVAVVLTMVTGELGAAVAKDLTATASRLDKPLFVTWLAGNGQTKQGRDIFRAAGMPVFKSVGDLARTAGLLAPSSSQPAQQSTAEAADTDDTVGLLRECVAGRASEARLLTALGISQPASTVATNAHEAAAAAEGFGRPVAMKVYATLLAHKSDVGGVLLGVLPADAADVYDELMSRATEHAVDEVGGVLVQEMISPGTELIIGATSAADGYAPVITVGIGGVTTELYRDVASELAPVTAEQAEAMLRRLQGWPLLAGFRGAAPADVKAAAEAVASVSRAVAGLAGQELEFEINPLIVAEDGGGAFAVDLLAHSPSDSRS